MSVKYAPSFDQLAIMTVGSHRLVFAAFFFDGFSAGGVSDNFPGPCVFDGFSSGCGFDSLSASSCRRSGISSWDRLKASDGSRARRSALRVTYFAPLAISLFCSGDRVCSVFDSIDVC